MALLWHNGLATEVGGCPDHCDQSEARFAVSLPSICELEDALPKTETLEVVAG